MSNSDRQEVVLRLTSSEALELLQAVKDRKKRCSAVMDEGFDVNNSDTKLAFLEVHVKATCRAVFESTVDNDGEFE